MIWRLLRKNISIGQILGYALANLIGLAIVLSAVRFYGDVSKAFDEENDENSLISEDFLVVSKSVSILNTLGPSTTFTEKEIDDILAQPWARDAGRFASADFSVSASVDFGGKGMSTFLFLESIPDKFIDINPRNWKFDPETADSFVPIIISKDYLALYNFGFATSRGLPQLSESLISKVPVTLQLSGNGHTDMYKARIVGFSARLNTIAVPEDFLTWANNRYSSDRHDLPSRLIVRVNKPGDPAINEYMEENGYEVAGDKLDSGRASYFLTVLTSIVIAIGAIISALALFILMLSIFLLLQKNRDKISNLLLLGYSPAQVSAGYFKLIGAVNAIVLVLSVVVMLVASAWWEARLESIELASSSPFTAILWGVVIMGVITAVNFIAISRNVRKLFKN